MPDNETAEMTMSQPEQTETPTCSLPDGVYNPAVHGPNFCPDCG
jgi:hypothetical protein